MKNALYVKGLAIAIAAAFLLMVGNGIGMSKTAISDVSLNRVDMSAIQLERPELDLERLRETRILSMSNPPVTPDSVTFDESFEDDILGNLPDDPPWAATEVASTVSSWWGPDIFENDIVGQNPNANWTVVDGTTISAYWRQSFESYTPPNALTNAAVMGDAGAFWSLDAAATYTAAAAPAGSPGGSVQAGLSQDSVSSLFVDGGAGSFFGSAGPGDTTVTTGYMGGWFYLNANARLDLVLYDYNAGAFAAEIVFYPGYTDLVHFPGGVGTISNAGPWAVGGWHEVFVEYDETTQTYSIWFDGIEYDAGSAFQDPLALDCNALIIMGDGTSNAYIDNLMHFVPTAGGGTHSVDVSGAWSCAVDNGNKSVYLDQNGYAGQQASASVMFPPPYAYGYYAGVQWYVMTSTTIANTNGATFRLVDFNMRTLMAIRFSGGQIQYQTGATWVNIQAFAANTEYYLTAYMDGYEKAYSGIWVDNTEYPVFGFPLVNPGAGVAGFIVEGTLGTQSEIYFDFVEMFGDSQSGTVRVSDLAAHSGSQSVRMWESSADSYTDLGAYLGGDGCGYGELWFHFYGDGTLGGGVVYVLDTTQTYLVTIISLGGDLSAAGIPSPGQLSWVNGDGAGGGAIIDGPTINPNTWNNVSIRYDATAKTFEARWNGVLQGTFGFLENGALDAGIITFFGEGPVAPCDWLFDDIGLWVDDLPQPAMNVRTYFPEPMPGSEAWYVVDQDNAVEGTVTGTYMNLAAVEGTTQDIQEAFIPGAGSSSSTEVRYMRADNVLGLTQSATDMQGADLGNNVAVYAGTRVWKLSGGVETEITSGTPVGIAYRAGGAGGAMVAGATWTPPVTPLDPADSIIVRLYQGTTSPPGAEIGTFTSEPLGATQLNAVAWQPNYYMISTRTNQQNSWVGWGSATRNTRIENFQWSTIDPDMYSLEHRWRTQNVPAGATTMDLYVTGMTSAGADDTFTFGYSTVLGGPYTPLITVNSGTMTTYTAAMPIMSGQFYINVIDNNGADTVQDTLYVDAISIYWKEVLGMTNANEVATADNPVRGTVTGTYALTTPIVPDGSAQQIAEVVGTATNYLTEDFATWPPAGWTADAHWSRSSTNLAGGTAPEAMFTWADESGTWRLASGPIDTTGTTTLSLQFRHLYDAYDPVSAGITAKVQTSTDGSTWMDTGFTIVNSIANVGPALATEAISVAEGAGSATLYIAFVVEGYAYDLDYWYVDSVSLTGTPAGYFATHRWTMQNMPLNTVSNTLTVTARTSATDETFNIGYAQTLSGPYTNIISVASTTFTTYTAAIPPMFDGSMYIQVSDTLAGAGDTASTSVYIDSLYVASSIAPVNTTVNVVWDLSADDGAGYNDVVQYNVYYSDQAIFGTYAGPFDYLGTSPAGSNMFMHYGEADDLVDNIWYYVTALDANGESTPTGVASKFNLAPEVTTAQVDSLPGVEITQGTAGVNLFAVIYDDSSTWENVIKMDGAEYYVDTDPGEGSGTMLYDMGFGTSTVQFTAFVDTSLWAAGNYTVYMRGHEYGPGNTGTGWGATSSVWINVVGGLPPYTIDMAGMAAGSWVFVSFPSGVTGDIQTILDDSISGDGLTTWSIARWYNPLDAADPWKTYRVGGTANDMPAISNGMGFWIYLTANGGDQVLTLSSYVATPASTLIQLYAGWNLVGYPSATATTGATLPAEVDILSVYSASAVYTDYVGAAMDPIAITHGNAYFVHSAADTVWTVTNP